MREGGTASAHTKANRQTQTDTDRHRQTQTQTQTDGHRRTDRQTDTDGQVIQNRHGGLPTSASEETRSKESTAPRIVSRVTKLLVQRCCFRVVAINSLIKLRQHVAVLRFVKRLTLPLVLFPQVIKVRNLLLSANFIPWLEHSYCERK